MPLQRLNLGCGTDIRPGWVNLDNRPLPGVDVVHNILHVPWPFPDEHFEEVHAKDVFEHMPCHYSYITSYMDTGLPGKFDSRFALVRLADEGAWLVLYNKDPLLVALEEVHRVLAAGGVLFINWPVPTRNDQFGDLTHYRAMSPDAFAQLDPNISANRITTSARFGVLEARKEGNTYFMRMVKV